MFCVVLLVTSIRSSPAVASPSPVRCPTSGQEGLNGEYFDDGVDHFNLNVDGDDVDDPVRSNNPFTRAYWQGYRQAKQNHLHEVVVERLKGCGALTKQYGRPYGQIVLEELKVTLQHQRWLHFPQDQMICALSYFGATAEHMVQLPTVFSDPAMHKCPVFPYRLTAIRKWSFTKPAVDTPLADFFPQTWKLLPLVGKTEEEKTANAAKFQADLQKDDYTFENRDYKQLPSWMDHNTAYHAYQMIIAEFTEPNPVLDAKQREGIAAFNANTSEFVIESYVARVRKFPAVAHVQGLNSVIGNEGMPSPEGIHQDGAEIVLLGFMGRENVRDQADSMFFDLDVEGGYYMDRSDEVQAERASHMLGKFVMHKPLEATIFLDRFLKHEARKFEAVDEKRQANRDILFLFTRRPRLDGRDFVEEGQYVRNLGLS